MSSPSTHNSQTFSSRKTVDSSIDVRVSTKDCACLVRAHLQRPNIEVLNWKIDRQASKVLSFLGEYLNLCIIINGEQPDTSCRVSYFVKAVPRHNDVTMRCVKQFGVFRKETMLFYLVLPQLQGDKGPTAWRPKCFLVRNDAIILEDIRASGFRCTSEIFLKGSHCLQTLKALARMHASSILFEHKKTLATGEKTRIGHVYQSMLFESCFNDSPWCRAGFDTILAIARMSKKYGEQTEYSSMVEEQLPDVLLRIRKLVDTSTKYQNVICHRNTWNKNIMYKYDEGGNPIQCILVDYQICTYSPPALDFNSFLYLNTRKEFRKDHYATFKANYYDELRNTLKEHHVAVEDYINQLEVDDSFEEYKLAGLIIAAMLLPLINLPKDILKDMYEDCIEHEMLSVFMKKTLVVNNMKKDPSYEEILLEIVDEIVENYIL